MLQVGATGREEEEEKEETFASNFLKNGTAWDCGRLLYIQHSASSAWTDCITSNGMLIHLC
jgi:hypothetical protein